MRRIAVELGLWLALAGAAFALTFEFAGEAGTYAWGAASWPRAIIGLMALMALAQFAVRRARLKAVGGPASGTEPMPPDVPADAGVGLTAARAKLAAALGLPLGYVYLLPLTGFYATTPFFLIAYLALLGERRPLRLVVAPLVIFAAVNLVFTRLFYVALPTGNWPGFYDFSNWFLVILR